MKKLVQGHFIIAVKEYQDSQYGEADYPTFLCVATKKYCSSNNLEKIRKFDSYASAQEYINSRTPQYKRNREFEIQYIANRECTPDAVDVTLWNGASFDEVFSDIDAIKIDLSQVQAAVQHAQSIYRFFMDSAESDTGKRREKFKLLAEAEKEKVSKLEQLERDIVSSLVRLEQLI